MPAKRLTKPATPPGADYTRRDAERLAERLVELQIQREEQIAERDRAILEASRPYAPEIDRLDAEIKSGLTILHGWAESNRAEFGDAESTALSGHRVGWRKGNWAVKPLSKWTWEKIVAALQAAPKPIRERYLRTKVEANKEALHEDRENADALKPYGVRFVQERRFYLHPAREGQPELELKA